MAYPISDVTRRVVYTGSAGVGPYSFTFEVLANTDIQVYKNTTLLTLTTNYTVTINSNGTGSVTLVVAATGADTITIVGDRAIQRATDFVTGGDLFANTLNDEFDSLVIFAQQVDEKADRGLKAPVTDPTDVNMVLPVKATRKGTVLAFDSTTGDPVAGPALDAVTTVIAQSANINTVAANIASVNTVAGNNTNVTTVAGVSGAVTTVAGISSNVTSVAGNSSNINTVAGNNTNVTTVAGVSGNVTTVAGISANVTTVAGISGNVTTVAGVSAAVTTNATNIASINTNATNITAIQNASTNATNAATSATNAANSATSASGSASTATTQASAASTSATNAASSASAAASSATAAAAAAASGLYRQVLDKTANYTVTSSDGGTLFRVTTTSGAVTITLPQISTITDGFKVSIVKWTGDANAVTVARTGSDTINGATSATIGAQYSQTTFVADYETNQWFAASSGLGTSNVAVDVFSGNNSTVAFTLSGDPGSKNNTLVEISGVYQQKSTYTVSGTTLTFSTAPPTGTSNIEVVWTAPLAIGTPSDGTVTTAKLASTTGSGAVVLATSPTITTPTISSLSSASATALTLQSAGTTAITVDTSQNVGVGTASPLGVLDVASGSNPSVRIRNTSTGGAGIWFGNSTSGTTTSDGSNVGIDSSQQLNLWNYENTATLFATNNTERMRINSSGQLVMATSTYGLNGQLQVGITASTSGMNSLLSVAGDQNGGYPIGVRGNSSTQGLLGFFDSSNSTIGSITKSGSNVAYNTSSDYRLKENIGPMTGALNVIAQLKPVTYTWKADGSNGQGFIAHELQTVVPDCVTGEKDAIETYKDENGNEQTRPKYQGVDTSFLVATLTAALQETKALIDTQAETINALTARVTALEGN
jgi:hypothetical protein